MTFLQRLGLRRFNQVKMTLYSITETFNLITNVPPRRDAEIHVQAENTKWGGSRDPGVHQTCTMRTSEARWPKLGARKTQNRTLAQGLQ